MIEGPEEPIGVDNIHGTNSVIVKVLKMKK